jgi:signal transduction histidine kinase
MTTDIVRILVVDDHPNTAATLARALNQLGEGVDVISATSGHEALDKVRGKGVDILITDMIMPEMTGLELIEKMQNHPGGRPAFTYLITAYDVPGLKVTAHRLKVNEVIVKPVRPERVCQIATHAMEEMKHATRPKAPAATGKRKFKILVADDKPDNVTLLSRYLQYEGYDHVVAQDGLEALDKVRDELPDLVLLDVNMPHKDGFTVLEEIRADPAVAHIPVIILTAARLDPADVQSGLNLGADDYVTKPFDRHELMARIRTKLRVKEAEDVIRRRNRELNLLPEIGKELSARMDVRDLANVLLKRTVETLGAIQGNMIMLGAEGTVEENYSVGISGNDAENQKIVVTDELLKHIRDTRQGINIANTLNDPKWNKDVNDTTRSATVVPLFGRRELLGLLILTHEQENYFTLEHLLLLQAIASQAAIAFENARLYAKVSQEQKQLDAVLQNAAEAILMFDVKGNLRLLNPIGQKLFTDFNARLNEKLPVGHGYDAFVEMITSALETHVPTTGETKWPDGRTFMALVTPIEAGGVVSILHDITRFKDLDKIKNEFIATASHDLKNPITTIKGFSKMLEMAGPLNDQQKDFVNRIQSAVTTMTELVQNMMDLITIDLSTGQNNEDLEIGDLLNGLSNEFKPQAETKKQSLDMEIHGGAGLVNGDAMQLKQLFRNLISNAIKYTPQEGTVRVTCQDENGNIRVDVQDTGYGIPADDLPHIFDRFYRVRTGKNFEEEGNGLGLAIVKSIAEKHGGQVNVTSEPNKGSTFTITLPLSPVMKLEPAK